MHPQFLSCFQPQLIESVLSCYIMFYPKDFVHSNPKKRYCTKVKAYEKIGEQLTFFILFPIFLEVNPRFPSEKNQQIPRIFCCHVATLPRCHVHRGGPVRCPRHVSYVGNKPDTFQIYQQNGKVPMSVSNMGKRSGGIIMLGLFMGYVLSGSQTWQWKNSP